MRAPTTSSLRALTRIAWRDAVRHRARSLLVVALVALPVAAIVGGTVVFATSDATPTQRAVNAMGQADLRVASNDPHDGVSALAARLPDGARIEPLASTDTAVRIPGGSDPVHLVAADLHGLASGMLQVVDGRAPTHLGEIAVSGDVLRRAGADLGGRVTLEDGSTFTVVGRVRNPELLSQSVVLVVPSAMPAPARTWLVGLPPGADRGAAVAGLSTTPGSPPAFTAATREEGGRRGTAESNALFVLGSLAFVEAALVVAAAFAVSIRRRQRELGLIAATGGHPGHLRGTLLLSGVVLGTVGGLAGTALGLLGAWGMTPWLQRWSNRVIDGLSIPTGRVVAAVVLGVVTATVAAWLPARAAARLPVVTALGGRRPPTRPSRRSLVLGMLLVLAGGALTLAATVLTRARAGASQPTLYAVMVGGVLAVLGFGALSPWLLDRLGRLAPRLPVGLRLAVRDTSRFRTRNGPVVTAVLAGLALSIAVGSAISSVDAADQARYRPALREDQLLVSGDDAATVATTLADQLPVVAAAPITVPATDGTPAFLDARPVPADGTGPVTTAVGTPDLVRALGGGDDAVAALQRGRAVLIGDRFHDVTGIDLRAVPAGQGDPGARTVGHLDVAVVPGPLLTGRPPSLLVPPAALAAAGWDRTGRDSGSWVVRLTGPVTNGQATVARRAAASVGQTTQVAVESGYVSRTTTLRRVLLVLSVVTALLVIAVALALAAAETRDDQRTLLSVGADPGLRRTLAAGRAAILACLGGLLAVPAGLLPVWGLLAMTDGVDFTPSWSSIGIAVVGLPVVAIVGAWALTRPSASWTAYRRAAG